MTVAADSVSYVNMYQKPDFLYDKENEDSTFVNQIERDNNICNSCYRKIRETFPTAHELAAPLTEYEEDADFAYFDDFKESGRPNSQESYCQCGAVDWQDARLRPIDSDGMMKIGQRLSTHLDEKDIEHCRQDLLNYIKENHRLPNYQDREELVFEEAVTYSLENIKTNSADEKILSNL